MCGQRWADGIGDVYLGADESAVGPGIVEGRVVTGGNDPELIIGVGAGEHGNEADSRRRRNGAHSSPNTDFNRLTGFKVGLNAATRTSISAVFFNQAPQSFPSARSGAAETMETIFQPH